LYDSIATLPNHGHDVREQILDEIRKLTTEGSGRPPGSRLFESKTGIREAAWRGVYWARWSDAIIEAGFEPNVRRGRHDEQFFMLKVAEACRHFGKFPTAMELRMYSKTVPGFPNVKSITRHFGSLANVPENLAAWARERDDCADIVAIVGERPARQNPDYKSSGKEGLVYLIRSGAYYKIGRSDEIERRLKEIRVALPDAATLVHSIRTDDPAGIEAYWHRRFADRRANGEWFKLTAADVSAFKRRKFQ
jgi:hypothetical protein